MAGGPQRVVGSPLGTDGLQSHGLIVINWCPHVCVLLETSGTGPNVRAAA